MMGIKGKIFKILAGVYYINTESGSVEAKAKGNFRNKKILPKVGDVVEVEQSGGAYRISSVLNRKNELIRPSVANIDKLVIVLSVCKPAPDLLLAEKLIFASRINGIEPIIVLNKSDLDQNEASRLREEFSSSEVKTFVVSFKLCQGLEEVKNELLGSSTCFAGQSAVGKSSITSYLVPDKKLLIGGLSKKTDRGKHTTRCCELYRYSENSYIIDTPGFSLFDDIVIDPSDFALNFNDKYSLLADQCKYRGCTHTEEPDCAVKKAVQDGKLSRNRYERYYKLYKQINENWRNRYD